MLPFSFYTWKNQDTQRWCLLPLLKKKIKYEFPTFLNQATALENFINKFRQTQSKPYLGRCAHLNSKKAIHMYLTYI